MHTLSSPPRRFLPGTEVAFLLLIDVIVAPLLVGVVHGEVPSPAGSSGAALLAAAVIGHEFAALREHSRSSGGGGPGITGVPTPPSVGGSKVRVSDANLQSGLLPSADDDELNGGQLGGSGLRNGPSSSSHFVVSLGPSSQGRGAELLPMRRESEDEGSTERTTILGGTPPGSGAPTPKRSVSWSVV